MRDREDAENLLVHPHELNRKAEKCIVDTVIQSNRLTGGDFSDGSDGWPVRPLPRGGPFMEDNRPRPGTLPLTCATSALPGAVVPLIEDNRLNLK